MEQKFNANSDEIIGPQLNKQSDVDSETILDLESEDKDFLIGFERVINDASIRDIKDPVTDLETSVGDPYLNIDFGISRGKEEDTQKARVKQRAMQVEVKPTGQASNTLMLDTRQYEVEFMDGDIEVYTANIIAENLLSQVEEEGHCQMIINEILDHQMTGSAMNENEGTFNSRSDMKRKKRTTQVWEICVQWKDGSTNWTALKDMKDYYPVDLADYEGTNNIQDEPAFAWWVPYMLRKRKRIIARLRSKYWEKNHKYGIWIPKSMKQSKEIDEENGNTLRMDVIRLKMKNVRIAFETYEGDPNKLLGYQEMKGHIVFNIKLGENFRRKARFCADGNNTESPAALTYRTVVSCNSARIISTAAAMKGLEVMGADVHNAFLMESCKEKIWLISGLELGNEQGKQFPRHGRGHGPNVAALATHGTKDYHIYIWIGKK